MHSLRAWPQSQRAQQHQDTQDILMALGHALDDGNVTFRDDELAASFSEACFLVDDDIGVIRSKDKEVIREPAFGLLAGNNRNDQWRARSLPGRVTVDGD